VRSVGIGIWRLGERLGLNLVGATEVPASAGDPEQLRTFEALIASAQSRDGFVDVARSPYPVYEFLTYLVDHHGLLLHGSNHSTLTVLEPQPAHDLDTVLLAVVACDDGIWPLFYAVVARDRVDRVVTACTHIGHGSRRRRFYVAALYGDPEAPATWTDGVVYALPRTGFRREWGNEWVTSESVQPRLRIPVQPTDYPLRHTVVGLTPSLGVRGVIRRLRAARP
jgi:hypothetical protein